MDPTTAIPLHLTCETVVLAAYGLLLAWSSLRRRWFATVSALALVIVQSLHAAQFVEHDDDPFLFAIRLAGVIGLAWSVLPMNVGREVFGAGLGALAGAALWLAIVGGTATDVSVGPHLLAVLGAGLLLYWVWLATRPSVRLRVLAAFVAVLAVAVVVAGGAVARVAAVNSRDEQYSRLAGDAATIRRNVIETRDGLRRRAGAVTPFLARAVAARNVPPLDPARLLPGEWMLVIDSANRRLADAKSPGVVIPFAVDKVGALPIVRDVRKAKLVSASSGTVSGLSLMAAAPVFRPGGAATAADIVGVVMIGRLTPARDLRAVAADTVAQLAIVDGGRTATTDRRLTLAPLTTAKDVVTLRTIDTGKGGLWLAAITPLPDGTARAVVAAPISTVVTAATDLVRAFLIAILAAALLAVVAALWLSARIARPMLDLADEAERVKADFLASVSHELRTPLTPIRGYTEILRRGRVPAGDASGYLDEIGQAAQRLERIVALLLDVAAIEAGRFRIDPYDVVSADLLNEAEERWRGRSRRHKIQVNAPRTLPKVMADPEAIARVLDELIDNALKFAPGGVVDLRARKAGDAVEFSVRDEGPGIDVARVEALREAFSQADSGDTRQFGGLGLGLAFAEGVVAAHGAQLAIATAPDEGTTCSFTLPVASSVTRMSAKVASRRR